MTLYCSLVSQYSSLEINTVTKVKLQPWQWSRHIPPKPIHNNQATIWYQHKGPQYLYHGENVCKEWNWKNMYSIL